LQKILKGESKHQTQETSKGKLKKTLRKQRRTLLFAYPAAANDSLPESCDIGGTGEPPLSSDGVFDKNKLPPISETKVMGEL
jgi:hypothetical protein